jgi:opacity protein-like surface antigen
MRFVSSVRFACSRAELTFLVVAGCSLTVASRAHAEASDLRPEIGYNYGEIETPRTAAMGGAMRAMSGSLEALFMNPANMAASRVYHLGAFAQIWPEANRQSYGAGIVDSVVSRTHLAGGFGGTWNLQDPDGVERRSMDLRFALAFPFSDQFFIGLGGRYLALKQDGVFGGFGALDPSPASSGRRGETILKGFAFDAGATFKPSDSFAVSIVGANLNNPNNGFQPTSVGGGIGFGTPDFTVEADVLGDFTTWDKTAVRGMGGFELLIADSFPIRAGYRYDQGPDSHAASLGLGYIASEFAAEVAVRRVLSPSEEGVTAVVIGFKYHLESTGMTPDAGDTF